MAERKTWNMSGMAKGQGERWIRQQYNAAIKAANDRIKTITKPEYAGRAQAYEYYVKADLNGAPYTKQRGGQTVFKALPRGADREQALEALRMVERFLGAKTSTARGIRETEEKRRGILNDLLHKDFLTRGGSGSAATLFVREAEDILRWMGSEEGKAAKANYDSNQVREGIAKATIAGRGSSKSVSELYQDWLQSEQSLADWIEESENQIGYNNF